MTEELIKEARDMTLYARTTKHGAVSHADMIDKLADALEAERGHIQSLAKWVDVAEEAPSIDIACEASAALEAATPEWEYQWGEPGETFEGFDAYSTFDEARSEMAEESEYESHCVLRRRKAGPWLPAEGDVE